MKILCIEQFRDLGGGQLVCSISFPVCEIVVGSRFVAIPGEGPLAERVRNLHFDVELFDAPAYTNGRKRAMDVARYATELPKLATHLMMQLIAARKADLLYVNASRMLPMASLAARGYRSPWYFIAIIG